MRRLYYFISLATVALLLCGNVILATDQELSKSSETMGPVSITAVLPELHSGSIEFPIIVKTGNRSLNAIDIHFNFDTSAMEITGIKSIEDNRWMEMQTVFDNQKGTLDYAAVSLTESSGDIVVCTVKAEVKKMQPKLGIEFVYSPQTRHTRAEYNGENLCGSNVKVIVGTSHTLSK